MQEVVQAGGDHLQLVPAGAQQLRARFPDDVSLPVTLVQLLLGGTTPGDAAEADSAEAGAAEAAALALLHDEALLQQLSQVRPQQACGSAFEAWQ